MRVMEQHVIHKKVWEDLPQVTRTDISRVRRIKYGR